MNSETIVEFNFANYIYNLNKIKQRLNGKKLCLVLKSDAYGCGLKKIVEEILPLKIIDYIAITENVEAKIIRDFCKNIKIIRIKPANVEEIKNGSCYNIEEILDSIEKIKIIKDNNIDIPFHLSINSGMNNFGINVNDIVIKDLLDLNIVGIMSHFPDIIREDTKYIKEFEILYKELKYKYFPKMIGHIKSSVNVAFNNKYNFDMVRVGFLSYGMVRKFNENINLKQVLNWKPKVSCSKIVKKGENIGYKYTYTAEKDLKILVLDCGFNKGFPSLYNSDSQIKINDQKQQIVGSVNMNTITINVTDICHPIQQVTLLGDGIYLEDIADEKKISLYSVFFNILTNNKIKYLY